MVAERTGAESVRGVYGRNAADHKLCNGFRHSPAVLQFDPRVRYRQTAGWIAGDQLEW